ncbi:hypothetical protein QBC36DRAFT_380216 [Triangularia setosa]|uniref:Uncharacterized protein n=1 Tax=Triangularia setosa TaxID=2587417 RepID=A0AAN6W6C6_9PEZI|nr:hypothetical protein QBC36DRAFT_380216 [Podospora setosa]
MRVCARTGALSYPLTPEQQAETITCRFERAPAATSTIPPDQKPHTYDPEHDLPEYSFDALLAKFHRQTQEAYAMEAEICAENEARNTSGELPRQKIPEGWKPPTCDPKYDLLEYSFDALIAKLQRQTQELYVMETEIQEEQRARLEGAKMFQEEREAAVQQLQQPEAPKAPEKGEGGNQDGYQQQQPPLLPIPPTSQQNQVNDQS